MRPTELADAAPANGAPRKRASTRRVQEPPPEQKLADFAPVETAHDQPEMWPVHAIVWLQPDLRAAAPQCSGLRPERLHRIPVPDFLTVAVSSASQPQAMQPESQPLPPANRSAVPACDLEPLGWDPRTEVRR
jgi:hypothetical protein